MIFSVRSRLHSYRVAYHLFGGVLSLFLASASSVQSQPRSIPWIGVGVDRNGGARVVWIAPGSPASSQLRSGEIIVQAGSRRIFGPAGLRGALRGTSGRLIQLEVRSGSHVSRISVAVRREAVRSTAVLGHFRGNHHSGSFTAYVDWSHGSAGGVLSGSGDGTLTGAFSGPINRATGAARLPLTGQIHLLFTIGVRGSVAGHIRRDGSGSGSFEGKASLGTEKGTWTCTRFTGSPDSPALL